MKLDKAAARRAVVWLVDALLSHRHDRLRHWVLTNGRDAFLGLPQYFQKFESLGTAFPPLQHHNDRVIIYEISTVGSYYSSF